MQILRPLTLLLGLTVLAGTVSAQSFEGRIRMTIKDGSSKPLPMSYAMKTDRVRIDLPSDDGQSVASIMNFKTREMMILMPAQAMYIVMPIEEVTDKAKAVAGNSSPLEKTNETEVILGYTCTKYLTRDRDVTTEIWAAEGIGMFAGMGTTNPMKPVPRNAWESELTEKGFFPLRVVSRNKANREQFRLEVTAIEKAALADGLFTVPEGYERFDMGGMMKGALKGMLPFGR